MASALIVLDQPTQGIEHLGFALALSRSCDDKAGEALHTGNCGLAYSQLGQLEAAEVRGSYN